MKNTIKLSACGRAGNVCHGIHLGAGAVLVLAAVLASSNARAETIAGAEWEFGNIGFAPLNPDKTWKADGATDGVTHKDIFCSKEETEHHFPVVKITSDLNWAKGGATLEIVTAPLAVSQLSTKTQPLVTEFFTAMAQHCTSPINAAGRQCVAQAQAVLQTLNEKWQWCAAPLHRQPGDNTVVDENIKGETGFVAKGMEKNVKITLAKLPFSNQNTQVNVEVSLQAIAENKLMGAFGNKDSAAKTAYGQAVQFFKDEHDVNRRGILILMGYGAAGDLASYKMKYSSSKWVSDKLSGSDLKNSYDAFVKTRFQDAHLADAIGSENQRVQDLKRYCASDLAVTFKGYFDKDCVLRYYSSPNEQVQQTVDFTERWAKWKDHEHDINPWQPQKPLSPLLGNNRVVVEIRNANSITGNAQLYVGDNGVLISRPDKVSEFVGQIQQ